MEEADLVRHDEEWKARFEADYQGKAVVFDDEVCFDDAPLPDGRRRPCCATTASRLAAGRSASRLEDLIVLQPLARERPQRMLFGGRLSAVERGPGGQWVVRFDPDSGVLLTDRGAAGPICPAPLDPGVDRRSPVPGGLAAAAGPRPIRVRSGGGGLEESPVFHPVAQRRGQVEQGLPLGRRPKPWPPVA